jgi:hypothetical protein
MITGIKRMIVSPVLTASPVAAAETALPGKSPVQRMISRQFACVMRLQAAAGAGVQAVSRSLLV